MKEGYRFVDCDMHIMEPPDLFDKYLDPEFKHRVTSSVRRTNGGPTGMRGTQFAPPGTGVVPSNTVMAGSPFLTRVMLMSGAA